ncbi:MAG: osmoprotectant NAGGN system M42 family peptidase [Bdellovibrionales bacterium]|nr:osmoprotectant NAGGN system M42 family peptidase [Bdellovibrionales bacterium]
MKELKQQEKFEINGEALLKTLMELLQIPSPSGYTDQVVMYVAKSLRAAGLNFELTRRGAIRAHIPGKAANPSRAVVAHIDTLGAMVRGLKSNGRLEVTPIGHWSSRFAEGARVTVFTDSGPRRGTILPIKSSGHTFNEEIDTLPVSWDTIELRVDERCYSQEDLTNFGYRIGDFISIDPNPEYTNSGFLVSRHLDNKAGAACLITAAATFASYGLKPPVDSYFLFTISEEVGSGASAVLHGEVSEMVSIDNSTVAPGQNSTELGVTVAMKDSTGPFDYHLTHKLIDICDKKNIPYARDVFRYYLCDAASALEAGNDIRTALLCFGCDSSHGYERTHVDSLKSLTELLCHYVMSPPTFYRDARELSGLDDFPMTQPQLEQNPQDTEVEKTLKPLEYKND